MADLRDIIGVLVAVAIVVPLLGVMAGLGSGGFVAVDADTTDFQTVDATVGGIPNDVVVQATTESAVALDGNASIESTAPQNLTNQSWTVCAAAELGDGSNLQDTYDVFAYQSETILLQYDAGQWSLYYNDSSESAKVALPATNPQAGFTPVCGRYDQANDSVSLMVDGTISGPVAMDGAVGTRNLSRNWTGRIDEVRTFDRRVSNSTAQTYASDPVKPLPGTNRSARFMLDEGEGGSTKVYFASSDATLVGASWVSGIPGPETDNRLLTNIQDGQDYELQSSPFGIRLLAGGYLEGAPVVYVKYGQGTVVGGLYNVVITLVALTILVAIANRIRTRL